jgi:hypothetical protein
MISAVGATFCTVTVWVAVGPAAPSLSVALALTCVEAGPSATKAAEKRQLKLPAVFVNESDPTFVPFGPQLVETLRTVSATPGSKME